MRRFARTVAAALGAAALVAGCADERVPVPDEGHATDCALAFDRAAKFSTEPRLEQTLVACEGIGEWVPAAASHPNLVPTENEVRFAASICATAREAEVLESRTCVQAFERYPELRPQPPGDRDLNPDPVPDTTS